MRCEALVEIQLWRKKGSGEPCVRVHPVLAHPPDDSLFTWYGSRKSRAEIMAANPELQVCGGEFEAKIEATWEPKWGGRSPVLEINYRCNRCGVTVDPRLPKTAEDLSRFVTDALKARS